MSPEERLRHDAPPEVDYVYLSSLLRDYARPRQEISRLLKKAALIRVKKGLYAVPDAVAGPYSKNVFANLIYGPSYISLESALRHYGLIPERVEELTCVTCNREKVFDTPIGRFSYRYLRPALFSLGVTQETFGKGRHALIASPEKAIVDKLWLNRQDIDARTLKDFLYDDLRIEPESLGQFNLKRLLAIVEHYTSETLDELTRIARRENETE